MGNETAELVESGEKRDGRGRKIVPLERQRELIAAYENAIRVSVRPGTTLTDRNGDSSDGGYVGGITITT